MTTTEAAQAQTSTAPVAELALRDVTLADLARRCGGTLIGQDRPIRHLRPVSGPGLPGALTFAGNGRYVRAFLQSDFEAAIVQAADIGLVDTTRRSLIIHPNAAEAFFGLHVELMQSDRYGRLEDQRDDDADIASSAVVHAGVRIGRDVRIDEHAVVYPNSILGDGVIVAAGSVVGGDGFQVVTIGGRRVLIPHAGGVMLGDGVAVGSQNCIDRGLFSTFTMLGSETMVDNMIHVAHDVVIGERCTLAAGSEVSGSAVMEDDVWYAPGVACNQFVRFGRGALVGTGSVVVRDVDPFTLVRGNPARPAGQVCLCRAKLSIGDEWIVRCPSCRREYAAPDGVLTPL